MVDFDDKQVKRLRDWCLIFDIPIGDAHAAAREGALDTFKVNGTRMAKRSDFVYWIGAQWVPADTEKLSAVKDRKVERDGVVIRRIRSILEHLPKNSRYDVLDFMLEEYTNHERDVDREPFYTS